MRVLITGSSGEIGTNLALRLRREGAEVFGIDRRPNAWTDEFPYALQDLSARYVHFDGGIGDVKYPGGIDVVVHLAANAKVHELVREPNRAVDNILITSNVLEFCRHNSLPVIFSSSREVYGDVARFRTEEFQTHVSYTESPYSASKIAGEALTYAYAKCYGVPYLVFRLSNVYGRYDNDIERMERVIPLFIRKISRGEPITVYGKDKTLDFTYVDDCVEGLLLGIKKLHAGEVRNETINLAYGEGHTLLELVDYIASELGKRPAVAIEPPHVGEVTRYIADISKAKTLLGYAPKVPLREGVRRAISWQREWAAAQASGARKQASMAAEPSHKNQEVRKILFLSAFYPPYRGGAEVFVEEISKRLAARGHEVTVLTSRLSRALAKDEAADGVRIIRVGLGAMLDKYLYPLLAFAKSFSIPHDIAYAVLESYAGLAAAFYKLFWRLFDYSSSESRAGRGRSREVSHPVILNLQSGTLDDWRRGFWLNAAFSRFIHVMPDAIHAISRHLAARARWHGARKVVVIPNGIDLKKFMIDVPRDDKKIVCVGRLYPVKGQEYLLRAMPRVLKEFPDVKLHLVGDGPDRERLAALTQNLGISKSVIFRGDLPHDEIPREIASARLFAGPSLREGQGIVFAEAMAAGAPVIGTAVGGIPEIIEDGVTGLLVPPKDPEAFAQAILKLLRDPAYARKLADEARKYAVSYDWERIADKVERLIEGV